MTMKPGALRHLITIQSRTETTDGYGGTVHVWVDFATVWAAVYPLRGRELIAAQAAQSETTVRFIIRYLTGLLPAMRIVYGGKNYNITALIDVEEAHREIQIMASVGLSEG